MTTLQQSRKAPPGPKPTVERRLVDVLNRISTPLLRGSLATTFIWFGALKIAGAATLPGALIAATLPWIDPAWSVPVVGAVEVALGLALLTAWRTPLVACALVAHLSATFLVLLLRPDLAFLGGDPLVLSVEGEFVVKNLVLIAAATALAARQTTGRRPPGAH